MYLFALTVQKSYFSSAASRLHNSSLLNFAPRALNVLAAHFRDAEMPDKAYPLGELIWKLGPNIPVKICTQRSANFNQIIILSFL